MGEEGGQAQKGMLYIGWYGIQQKCEKRKNNIPTNSWMEETAAVDEEMVEDFVCPFWPTYPLFWPTVQIIEQKHYGTREV